MINNDLMDKSLQVDGVHIKTPPLPVETVIRSQLGERVEELPTDLIRSTVKSST
jgi:hypothetical protein